MREEGEKGGGEEVRGHIRRRHYCGRLRSHFFHLCRSPSGTKVVSATSPFPIATYDDPVAENLEKNDISMEIAEKYLGLTTAEL